MTATAPTKTLADAFASLEPHLIQQMYVLCADAAKTTPFDAVCDNRLESIVKEPRGLKLPALFVECETLENRAIIIDTLSREVHSLRPAEALTQDVYLICADAVFRISPDMRRTCVQVDFVKRYAPADLKFTYRALKTLEGPHDPYLDRNDRDHLSFRVNVPHSVRQFNQVITDILETSPDDYAALSNITITTSHDEPALGSFWNPDGRIDGCERDKILVTAALIEFDPHGVKFIYKGGPRDRNSTYHYERRHCDFDREQPPPSATLRAAQHPRRKAKIAAARKRLVAWLRRNNLDDDLIGLV